MSIYKMIIKRGKGQPDFIEPDTMDDYLRVVYILNLQGITFGTPKLKQRYLEITIEQDDPETVEKVKKAFKGWGDITYQK